MMGPSIAEISLNLVGGFLARDGYLSVLDQ